MKLRTWYRYLGNSFNEHRYFIKTKGTKYIGFSYKVYIAGISFSEFGKDRIEFEKKKHKEGKMPEIKGIGNKRFMIAILFKEP